MDKPKKTLEQMMSFMQALKNQGEKMKELNKQHKEAMELHIEMLKKGIKPYDK